MPKGQKNAISKENFKIATKGAGYTKGLFAFADFKDKNFADSKGQIYNTTKDNFIKYLQENKIPVDNLYIYSRYKNIPFAFDIKSKVFYKVATCCDSYIDLIEYFFEKNQEYKKENIVYVQGIAPANLRARGCAIDKIAESAGITL